MRIPHSLPRSHKRRRRTLFVEQLEARRLLAADMNELVVPPAGDEPWPDGARATIDLVVTDSQGFPISQIEQGGEFRLQAWTRQLDEPHQSLRGVFGAWTDIDFDSTHVSIAGEIVHGPHFVNGLSGTATPGLLDEVGGFRDLTHGPEPPPGLIGELLFEVALAAESVGEVTFSANRADDLPLHDTLLVGSDEPLAETEVVYGEVRLNVVSVGSLVPAPDQNPDNPFDATADGIVTPVDTLRILHELNCQSKPADCNLDGFGHFTDVNGDGRTSRTDFLLSFDHIYAKIKAPDTDLPAGWQNPRNPIDVNDDGIMSPLDGLIVRADLEEHGARKLPAPRHNHTPPPYLDVNGDGFVTKADEGMVWQFVDPFASEPEPPESPVPPNGDLVVIALETVDLTGQPVSQVNVGDDFYLQARANGTATPKTEIFAAFTDVTYDASLASVSGAIEHGHDFPEFRSGSADVVGLLDEVGGVVDLMPPAALDTVGVGSGVLFRVRMTANAVGDLIIASDPADLIPEHDVLLIGFDERISPERINYGETTLTIASASADAPTAVDDEYAIGEDGELRVSSTDGVLANDSDPNGDPLTVRVVETTRSGALLLESDGSFVYQPDADFFGDDTFTYEVSDGTGLTSRASVLVRTLASDDDAPRASSDTYAARVGQQLIIPAERGVLANDFDPDGDLLTASLTDGPAGLTLAADGSFVWSPPQGFAGDEVVFTYAASDGEHASQAEARIIIRDLDDEVVVFSLRATNAAGGQLTSVTPGEPFFLEGYVEDTRAVPEGVFAAYVDVTFDPDLAMAAGPFTFGPSYPNGQSGTVSEPGRLEEVGGFQSANERLGGGEHLLFSIPMTAETADELTFTTDVADTVPEHHVLLLGEFGPVPEELIRFESLTLNAETQNRPPVAVADQYFGEVGTALTVDSDAGVLANDNDPDADGLTVRAVNEPANGTLTLRPDGSFTYIASPGFAGTDSFSYVADDGELESQVSWVDLTIRRPGDGLVAIRLQAVNADGVPVDEVTVGDEFELRVLTEDLRPDPQGVFAVYADIEYDAARVSAAGEITFGPTYESGRNAVHTPGLIDETGAFTSSRAPLGGGEFFVFSQRFSAEETGQVVFASNAADELPFHDVLLYGINRAIDPDEIEFGTVSFVNVPMTDIVFSSFALQIVAEGEDPTLAVPDTFVVPFEAVDVSLSVLANDSNAVTAVTGVADARGSVDISADGTSLLYTAPKDFAGNDRFAYAVRDGNGNTDEVTVDVLVKSPFQNFDSATDTDDDGTVAPLDALYGVNELNRAGARRLQPADATLEGKTVFLDVNGDLQLSPIDVLIIINELNARVAAVAEGEAGREQTASERFKTRIDPPQPPATPQAARPEAKFATERTPTRREFFFGGAWQREPLLSDHLLGQLAADQSSR